MANKAGIEIGPVYFNEIKPIVDFRLEKFITKVDHITNMYSEVVDGERLAIDMDKISETIEEVGQLSDEICSILTNSMVAFDDNGRLIDVFSRF